MQLRRKIALLTGALVFTAPALTACGFDWATDRENDTIAGTNNRTKDVDVLNAVLVAAENGEARLVATFANNVQDASVEVTGVAPGEGSEGVTIKGFKPFEIAKYGMAAPAKDDAEVLVTGDDVMLGKHVRLVFDFSTGESAMVNVQVMPAWEEYAGWGPGGASQERPERPGAHHGEEHAEDAASATASAEATPSASHEGSAHADSSESAAAH